MSIVLLLFLAGSAFYAGYWHGRLHAMRFLTPRLESQDDFIFALIEHINGDPDALAKYTEVQELKRLMEKR